MHANAIHMIMTTSVHSKEVSRLAAAVRACFLLQFAPNLKILLCEVTSIVTFYLIYATQNIVSYA